jgi:hypothetical protein
MNEAGQTRSGRRQFRIRRITLALLLVATPAISGCTPEEIEASVDQIAVSFEQGGIERGLASAIFVAQMAIPRIGMRIGLPFGF